jgi:hypothetical protein
MRRFLLLIALAVAIAAPVFGQSIVAPNRFASNPGNDTSGPLPSGVFSARFQTVIDPSQFPGLGPINITGFTWRAAPGTGALNVSLSGNIYLSTSPNWANNSNGHPLMSTTFASNVGADNTLVVSLSNFMLTEAGCAAPGPCPFANNIVFTTPFPYNPANGPLLIDAQLTNLTSSGTGQFDVVDCPAASCVINGVDASPLASATGTLESSDNVTQVTYALASSQCDTFTDVLATANFCSAVQWLKNRQITLGCGSTTTYCPNDPVTRASMSLFMNRLGKVLSPEIVYQFGRPHAVIVNGAPPFGIYCQTADSTSTFEPFNHPTTAVITTTFSGLADNTIAWGTAIVYSDDGGATWNQVFNSNAHRASAGAGQWSEVTNVAATPVAPGAKYRAGILVFRDDASTGNFTDSRCQVAVTIQNANGASPPY